MGPRKPTLSPLVLVVEDTPDARDFFVECLVRGGFRCVSAGDGVEAVRLAGEMLPALVLMDMSLPHMDGWEAVRRLKADPRTRAIPVIAVTAFALDYAERDALAAGCDDYLVKPCTPDRLVGAVSKALVPSRA